MQNPQDGTDKGPCKMMEMHSFCQYGNNCMFSHAGLDRGVFAAGGTDTEGASDGAADGQRRRNRRGKKQRRQPGDDVQK